MSDDPLTPATEAGRRFLFLLSQGLPRREGDAAEAIRAIEAEAVTAAIESGRVVDPSSEAFVERLARIVADGSVYVWRNEPAPSGATAHIFEPEQTARAIARALNGEAGK